MLTIHDCKAALNDLRRRFSNADGETMLAKFGVKNPADIPEELRSMFVAACEGGPNSAIVAGLGAPTKPKATASADDTPAEVIDPYFRKGAEVNQNAQEYWDNKREADKATIPAHQFAPKTEEKAR